MLRLCVLQICGSQVDGDGDSRLVLEYATTRVTGRDEVEVRSASGKRDAEFEVNSGLIPPISRCSATRMGVLCPRM